MSVTRTLALKLREVPIIKSSIEVELVSVMRVAVVIVDNRLLLIMKLCRISLSGEVFMELMGVVAANGK